MLIWSLSLSSMRKCWLFKRSDLFYLIDFLLSFNIHDFFYFLHFYMHLSKYEKWCRWLVCSLGACKIFKKKIKANCHSRWQEVERLRGERNAVANKMKGKLDISERQKLIEEGTIEQFVMLFIIILFFRLLVTVYWISSGKNLKVGLATLEEDLVKLTDELQLEAQCIPNMTHPHVPIGGEDSSTVRKMVCKFFNCFLVFHKGNDA